MTALLAIYNSEGFLPAIGELTVDAGASFGRTVDDINAKPGMKVEVDENDVNLDGSILSGVGRIRDVAEGPDGYLYVITSNTDGKAFPSDDDDKLLRIMK